MAHMRTPIASDLVRAEGPTGILIGTAQRAVQLFLYSWSLGLFGPISISVAAHLFTKQLLHKLDRCRSISARKRPARTVFSLTHGVAPSVQ
jgi:hypothetical protein